MNVEITKRGKEPTHYFGVSVRATGSERRVHVGYIMRARPTDDEWFAAIKYRNGAPTIVRGPSPEGLIPEIKEQILNRLSEMK